MRSKVSPFGRKMEWNGKGTDCELNVLELTSYSDIRKVSDYSLDMVWVWDQTFDNS